MKNINFLLNLSVIALAPLSIFAVDIPAGDIISDVTYDESGVSGKLLGDIAVKNNAVLTITGTGWGGSSLNTSGKNIKIEAGSSFVFGGGGISLKLDQGGVQNTDIYGNVISTATGRNFIIIGDTANSNATMTFHEGSVVSATSGDFLLDLRRANATLNVNRGATLNGIGSIDVGTRGDVVFNGGVNISGSVTTATVNVGSTNSTTNAINGYFNVTNGGYLKVTTNFNIATGGAKNYSKVAISGLGSVVDATTINVGNANATIDYTADFKVSSGAKVKSTNFNVRQKSNIILNVNSNSLRDGQVAMIDTVNMNIVTSAGDNTFEINVEELGDIGGYKDGDIFEVLLFSVSGIFNLNGTNYTFASMTEADFQALLGQFLSFNFEGNDYWYSADLSDIYLNGSDVVLGLKHTAVPEPSVYAALFGALALALVFLRRRAK